MSRRFQLDSAIVADIQTVNADSYIDSLKMIDIDLIEPNKNNFYEMSEIEALADDIERQGLMTALVVSEQNGGKYELISGHRRLMQLSSLLFCMFQRGWVRLWTCPWTMREYWISICL